MTPRLMWPMAVLAVAGVSVAPPIAAQGAPTVPPAVSPAVSPALDRARTRARALLDEGEGVEARALLDSLVRATAVGSNDFAEALYWRATLSERVSEAERDWKRLIIDAPLSPRASDAMVRLGELEMLRGRPAAARAHYERVVREYPTGPARAKSQMGIVKSWVAQQDLPRACVALLAVSAGGVPNGVPNGVPDGELRLQAEEMGRRCATVEPKALTKVSAANSASTMPPNARFSVQLAAYDTRAEADAAVARFTKRGIDTRVDGEAKPYRVRTGYYPTRDDATAALAKFKRAGQTGFLVEIAK